MKIHKLVVGMLATNCYVLESAQKNALVIDPGDEAEKIFRLLEEKELTLRAIAFTHGHFDHIGAAEDLRKTAGVAYLPREDVELLEHPELASRELRMLATEYIPKETDILYGDGDALVLDEITLRGMHTPGHTKGSYLLLGDGVLFAGDTLFAGSTGRTDLYGGSRSQMWESLKKIAAIEGEYTVFPGHGEATTLARERRENPQLRMAL